MTTAGGDAATPSILAVDDNPDDLAVFSRVAQKRKWRLDTANSGRAGLEKALGARYDLILLDYNLGDMTGTEVLLRLKESGVPSPILIQSGMDSHFILARSIALGADGFVQKDSPHYEAEVTSKIQTALRRATTLAPALPGRREGLVEVEKIIDDLLERSKGSFGAVGFASPDGFRVSTRFRKKQALSPETVCAMVASAASTGGFLGEGLGYQSAKFLSVEFADGVLYAAPIAGFGVLFGAVNDPVARAANAKMELEFAARELAALLGTLSRAQQYTS